jgi:hypothetical protein
MPQKTQQTKQLSERAQNNLSNLGLTLTTTSPYFRPEDGRTYVIKINPEDQVEMIKNPKFADKDGYIPTRFEFSIMHIDNGAQQKWTVSKTLCKQIADQLGSGYTVLEVTRHGADRSTVYNVRGIQ